MSILARAKWRQHFRISFRRRIRKKIQKKYRSENEDFEKYAKTGISRKFKKWPKNHFLSRFSCFNYFHRKEGSKKT